MVSGASLGRLKIMISSFENNSVFAKELKCTILIYITMDIQPTKADVIKNLQISLPFEIIFPNDIVSGTTVLFKIMRD